MAASSLQITRREDGSYLYEFTSHSQHILQTLNECRQFPRLCDCTVLVETRTFNTHKAVLIACSDYFKSYFTTLPDVSGQPIVLENVSARGFHLLLEFAYTSRMCLTMAVMEDVLSVAVNLKAASVLEACCEFLKSQLTGDNCVDIISVAETFNLTEIKRQANRLMCERLIELSQTYNKKGSGPLLPDSKEELEGLINANKEALAALEANHQESCDSESEDIGGVESDCSFSDMVPTMMGDRLRPRVQTQPPNLDPTRDRTLKVETKAALKSPVLRALRQLPRRRGRPRKTEAVQRTTRLRKTLRNKRGTFSIAKSRKEYICRFCTLKFGKLRDLRQHYIKEHSQCDRCTKVFRADAELERHLISHQRRDTARGPRRYVCTYCGKNCGYSSALKIHVRTHTGEKPFKCDLCSARFIQSINLKRHVLTNHQKDTPYECKFCDKKFSVFVYLKSHEITHSSERPFQCETCGAMFKRKSDLRSHNRVHSSDKPFTCDICLAKFKTTNDLKTHSLIHNDTKPHTCDKCGASFKRTGHLNRHMMIHSNNKPYQCETCGAQFNRKENLRSHQRIHSGEQPYKCSLCGASFRHLSSMKIHEKNHWSQRTGAQDTSMMSQHDGGSLQHIAALMGLPVQGLSLPPGNNIPVSLQVNTDAQNQLSIQPNHAQSPDPTPPLHSPGQHTPMNLHAHQQQNQALQMPPPNSTLNSPMASPMSMASRSPMPMGLISSASQNIHITTSSMSPGVNQVHQVPNLQAYMMNTATLM
ncbi:myoneurin-like [Asterias rubens]|uniref:myoneurin-like n=1 Tax=Asterias rubens TaxID=7604 RepID=UPI0014550662|nr:myoneurin-like [Asterias rubens]